jgi:Alpha-2,8-polysialyltransferase (POLYST)
MARGGDETCVCLVNGPFQALSLSAWLRSRSAAGETIQPFAVLVDMDPASQLHAATSRILRANGVVRTYTIPASTGVHGFGAAVRALEGAIDLRLGRVRMVASYGTHRPVARFLLGLMPDAELVIYEEGLRIYVPSQGDVRERLRMKLAGAWGMIDRSFGRAWTAAPQPVARRRVSLLLGERLPVPDRLRASRVELVPHARLRESIAALADPARQAPVLPDQPYGVIVGQYYARLSQMSEQTEHDAYLSAARALLSRGILPIWRGHIRTEDTTFRRLKDACPALRSFDELVGEATLPLECHASVFSDACRAVVSFSSSALFYLPLLYGTPAYTLLTPELVARMRYPHREGGRLALDHVSPL